MDRRAPFHLKLIAVALGVHWIASLSSVQAVDCPAGANAPWVDSSAAEADENQSACRDACAAATPDCVVWTPYGGESADGTLCQEDFDLECTAECENVAKLCFIEDDEARGTCEEQCRDECSERDEGHEGRGSACAVSCPFLCINECGP